MLDELESAELSPKVHGKHFDRKLGVGRGRSLQALLGRAGLCRGPSFATS